MGVKKLYCDGSRNDIAFDEIPNSVISSSEYDFQKFRNKYIDDIFEHGERTCKFYQKNTMDDVLKMFEPIPFSSLNIMIQDYIAGVQAIRDMDKKRALYLSAVAQESAAYPQEKFA